MNSELNIGASMHDIYFECMNQNRSAKTKQEVFLAYPRAWKQEFQYFDSVKRQMKCSTVVLVSIIHTSNSECGNALYGSWNSLVRSFWEDNVEKAMAKLKKNHLLNRILNRKPCSSTPCSHAGALRNIPWARWNLHEARRHTKEEKRVPL